MFGRDVVLPRVELLFAEEPVRAPGWLVLGGRFAESSDCRLVLNPREEFGDIERANVVPEERPAAFIVRTAV